jgi:hypothetical protein
MNPDEVFVEEEGVDRSLASFYMKYAALAKTIHLVFLWPSFLHFASFKSRKTIDHNI